MKIAAFVLNAGVLSVDRVGIHSGHERDELCGSGEDIPHGKTEKMGPPQKPGEEHGEGRQGISESNYTHHAVYRQTDFIT